MYPWSFTTRNPKEYTVIRSSAGRVLNRLENSLPISLLYKWSVCRIVVYRYIMFATRIVRPRGVTHVSTTTTHRALTTSSVAALRSRSGATGLLVGTAGVALLAFTVHTQYKTTFSLAEPVPIAVHPHSIGNTTVVLEPYTKTAFPEWSRHLFLLGVGLRSKYSIFSVYAYGLYVDPTTVTSFAHLQGEAYARAIAEEPCPKLLQLVFVRDITGADMKEAFVSSLGPRTTVIGIDL
jgi:hypothetical protein